MLRSTTHAWPRPLLALLLMMVGVLAIPALADASPGARPAARAAAPHAPSRPATAAVKKPGGRLGLREALKAAREELQLYRGKKLERWSDRLAYGKSDFRAGQSVKQNLRALAEEAELPTYTRTLNGREVLHVVVDLADGKRSKQALRKLFKRIGEHTVEVNFKAPGGRNVHGHVAVRVGGGATYDLTGTNGVAQLPAYVERPLRMLTGRSGVVAPRKRSMRRFFETRKLGDSAPVFYGMLFQASAADLGALERGYEQRLGQVKQFNVSGGDPAKGEFSCAQFLTHETPFLQKLGIKPTISAKGMAADAAASPALEAVIVYKMPTTGIADLPQLAGFQDD